MYLVAIAWLYVALMMAVAEAMHPGGTVLGAIFTLLMYGIGPVALVLYLLGAPMRAKARRRAEQAAVQSSVDSAGKAPSTVVAQPDEAGHAAGDAVATVREEP
jgi:hypothetical protein